ncbi:MAG: hypothetical protein HW380_494 [Magnetococcales bacterium]|nr:hypothetical protein [Magnetococcales bacterium]
MNPIVLLGCDYMIRLDHPLQFRKTFSEDRYFILSALLVGIAAFTIVAIAWPVSPGRESVRYFLYYYDINYMDAIGIISQVPPGVPLILGNVIKLGYAGAFAFALFCYLTALVSTYYVARLLGKTFARIITIIALMYISQNVFMHELSGDPVFTLGVALWAMVVVRLHKTPTFQSSFIIGIVSFFLVLLRPVSQIFIIVCFLPLVCFGISKNTIIQALTLLACFCTGLLGLSLYNYHQFGGFNLAALSKQMIPARNAFIFTNIMSPDYGPASRRLADLIVEKLLDSPQYKNYGVTLETVFTSRDKRILSDLEIMDAQYGDGVLRAAAWEAISRKPFEFIHGCYILVKFIFEKTFFRFPPKTITQSSPDRRVAPSSSGVHANKQTEKLVGIPVSYYGAIDIENEKNWSHEKKESQRKRVAYLNEVDKILRSQEADKQFRQFIIDNIIHPLPAYSMKFFMLLSFLIFLRFRTMEVRLLFMIFLPQVGVIVFSTVFAEQSIEYRMPFDFFIILLGMAGVAVAGQSMVDRGMFAYLNKKPLLPVGGVGAKPPRF